jgi:hypothetical protein
MNFLSGYKTYVTAAVTVFGALMALFVGEAELANTIQLVVTAVLGATIRAGVASS